MSRRRQILIAWLLLSSSSAFAQAPASSSAATESIASPRSSELQRAEQAVRRDGYAPSRLLALGQAQLAQGELGPAIVSFERGIVLSPRDPALRQALENARMRAGLSALPEASWWSRIENDVSLREWSFAAWTCSAALAIALLGLTLAKRGKRLLIAGVLTSAIALAITGGAAYAAQQRLSTAFVLHSGSVLRRSPFDAADVLGALRVGEAVEPKGEHADFVYVHSEQGQLGWIRKQELAQLAAGALSPT